MTTLTEIESALEACDGEVAKAALRRVWDELAAVLTAFEAAKKKLSEGM